MSHFGNVHVETAVTAGQFQSMLAALNLTSPVLIKPNWGTVECYTEAEILDWTLAAIPGEKLVIESHGWARNEETLLHKPAGKLTKANLRRGDAWFLEFSGNGRILEKHGVEYLNLTEEIWAGRAADPDAVRQAVEAKYSPLQFEELYTQVPARLFDLRGATLLSLSKYKMVFYPLGVSLAIKNLFGLIPGPSRGKYHGPEHVHLDQSILEINKIYRSLFAVKGVVEGVRSAGLLEKDGEKTEVRAGCGMAFASEDLVALDAVVSASGGRDPAGVGHVRVAAETFGPWDAQACEEAARSGLGIF